MLIVNCVAALLLLGGPILGYRAAMHRRKPKRGVVIAWSVLGGAAAAILLLAIMFLSELWYWAPQDPSQKLVPLVIEFVVCGFLFGLVGVLRMTIRTRQLLTIGLVMTGLTTLGIMGVRTASGIPSDQGAAGHVVYPDTIPVVGAYVFLDRGGSGPLERLTTDSTGRFRAKLKPSEYPKAIFLVCVPGMIPWAERPQEGAVIPQWFRMMPVAPHSDVESGLRLNGWRLDIPAVCQASELNG